MTTEAPAVAPAENLLGKRIAAGLIDSVVLFVLFVLVAAIFGDSSSGNSSFSLNLSGLPAVLYFALVIAYYIVPEATSGQTLGKKLIGLRVTTLDGSALTWGKVIVRNLLRIVDGLPALYLVGIIAIMTSKSHQRIGDMAASTVVVRA